MRLTNKQVVKASDALAKMLNTSLPVRQAYSIKKTAESIKKQILFIEEQRIELVKKYGEKDGDNYKIVDKKKENLFYKDYNELLNLKEDIDVRQLGITELDGVELTPNEFETIEFMIKE